MAHIFAFCFTPRHVFFLNNAFYKLAKNNFLSLSSNLSYPENFRNNYYIAGLDLENSKKGGVSQALFFKLSFCLFLFSLSSLCSLFQSSLFSLSSFPLASLPSLFALLINSLSSYSCFIQLVYLAKRR